MNRRYGLLVLVSIAVASAVPAMAQVDMTSGIMVASNVPAPDAGFHFLRIDGPWKTQAVDVRHGVSYGLINWSDAPSSHNPPIWARTCTAGERWRLADESELTPDYYERLGHWSKGEGSDPFKYTRGICRYDADTFITLSTQEGHIDNYNGVRPPALFQVEYRADWYLGDDMPTDNQWMWFGSDMNNQLQAAQAPWEDGGLAVCRT